MTVAPVFTHQTTPEQQASAPVLDVLLESFFRRHPVAATFAGIHDHDHVLPDFSPEGTQSAREEMCVMRRRLAETGYGVLHSEELVRRDWESIDGALADAVLEVRVAEDESRHFERGNPTLALDEALWSVIGLADSTDTAGMARRVEAAVSRLRAFPAFLHGARRTLGDGEMPAAWRDLAMRKCDGGLLLLADLSGWPVAAGVPVSLCRDLQDAAAHAGAAVEWYRAWLSGRPAAPLSRYAAGHGLLALVVRRSHWCDTPVERLRHEARAALEREMFHLRDAIGDENWPAVSSRLVSTHPDTGDTLHAARALWTECRELSSGEVTWPDTGLEYQPAPAWIHRAAALLEYLPYRAPAPYAEATGRYDVIFPDPTDAAAQEAFAQSWNRSAMKLTHVARYGGLGHHVRDWHAAQSPSRIGRVAGVRAASRTAMSCAGTMIEGWAGYATEIVESLGFLTPDERMAQHHMRVCLMTCAVVDLELHTGRMSFDDAVRFQVNAAQLSPAAAHAEVTRCSMFPGTAMQSWLGLRELWRVRSAEEASKGASFSSRVFHDELLSFGSIPVPLAARLMSAARGSAAAGGQTTTR